MREGWSYKKLGDCFPYIKNGANIKQIKDAEGLPITRIETLSNGLFNRDKMGYANIMEIGKYSEYILEDQDLLMSHINSKTYIGRTVEYKKEGDEVIIHGMNLLKLKADKSVIIPRFFFYYSFSYKFKFDVSCVRKDAVNQSSMAIGDLKRFSLPIPPLTTQQQIVSELDLLSHILDQKRQQLKEYDALAESIFYDMFGDPVENPKGWEVKKLGELSHLKNGLNFEKLDSGNLIKILGVSDFQNNRTVTPKGLTSIYLKIPVEEYLLKDNDLVFVRSNGSKSLIGRCVIMETDNEDIVFSGFCIRCRLTSNSIHPQFVSFVMQTKSVRDQITNAGQGCNISNVNQKILGSFLMIVPPLSLQRSFASKIESIEHQKQLLRASIKETEMLFQSRMDYWFNS